MRMIRCFVLDLIAAISLSSAAHAAGFMGLGDLPGGRFDSTALAARRRLGARAEQGLAAPLGRFSPNLPGAQHLLHTPNQPLRDAHQRDLPPLPPGVHHTAAQVRVGVSTLTYRF